MIMIRFTSEVGEVIDFVPEVFMPLSYSDLPFDHSAEGKTYSFKIDAKSIQMPGTTSSDRRTGRVSLQLNFPQGLSVFALVPGGWLPPPFVIPSNFLVDRNVVSDLVRIRRGLSPQRMKQNDWWFQFFDHFNAFINPALYALEGDKLRHPTFDEFRKSFDEAAKEIETQLPGARLVSYDSIHYQAAYQILTNSADRYGRETKFLMCVAPKVTFRLSDSELLATQKEIIRIAGKLDLKTHSLSVLTILACLYENADGSGFLAARRIIKPSTTYSAENAHNAIADLRALETFIFSLGLDQEPLALCTCDRAIAALWCGLDVHGHRWNNDVFSFTVSLTEHLFPRIATAGREELAAALVEEQ